MWVSGYNATSWFARETFKWWRWVWKVERCHFYGNLIYSRDFSQHADKLSKLQITHRFMRKCSPITYFISGMRESGNQVIKVIGDKEHSQLCGEHNGTNPFRSGNSVCFPVAFLALNGTTELMFIEYSQP